MNTQITSSSNNTLYETIFALLRSALWGEERFPFHFSPDTDWEKVYQELCHQTVQTIPIDLLSKVDSKNQQKYFQSVARRISQWYTLMQEQQALYKLLQNAGIAFSVLKGASADCYYPQPTYRAMGDIDFIVKSEDFDRTFQLLVEHHYIFDHEDIRHSCFKKNGILFELHKHFASFNDLENAQLLDNRIFTALDHIKTSSLEGFSFCMLPALENGLVLLEHINQHMETGLGLRQIMDWMLYVDKELDNETWNTTFAPLVKPLGLETLAITVTRMCQIYLGLSEKITWCQNADSMLCEKLMDYIIDQGNFGRKHGTISNNTVTTISFLSNIPAFFKRLQNGGCDNWTVLKKHPWLKPFAWIYQICRYIKKGFSREKPFRNLWADIKRSRHQENFFEQLGIVRRKKGVKFVEKTRY